MYTVVVHVEHPAILYENKGSWRERKRKTFTMISFLFIFGLLGSSTSLQDDIQRNHLLNDLSFQNNQNQDYLVQQRPVLMQNYQQHYVPVPIQLLHRSVYTQQPQAALIIVKAFPVLLSPSQASHFQGHQTSGHQDVSSRIPNIQMVHYNVAQAPVSPVQVYSTAQPPQQERAIASSSPVNNYVAAANPGLYYAPPSTAQTAQGDSYLNQLAQVVAQQYSKSPNSNFKAPAIIAGLENFSLEQQNQIKNHLKNYITSHGDGEKDAKDAGEQREVVIKGGSQDTSKYSSKISRDQYTQQSGWVPAVQSTE